MDKEQAIETLRANYPDACYEQLREAVDAAIEALKAQDAAGDTISRQAAIESFEDTTYTKNEIRRRITELPSAQPERKTGKWLKTGQSFVFPGKFRNYFCSECGFEIEKTAYNYCPNCGAKMEGINVLQS